MVVEVEGDRPKDPGEDDVVETQPRGGLGRDRGIDEDVVVEGVAAEGDVVPVVEATRRQHLHGVHGVGGTS